MAGGEHEIALRDDGDDVLHRRQQFAVPRHRHERPILLRRPHLVLGIEGRHPDDAAPAAGDGRHVFDGGGVDAADGQVQRDAAEHLDTGHDLANQIGQAGRGVVVILQNDRPLLPRLRELGDVDGVDRSRPIVGVSCARERRSSPRADGRDRLPATPWLAVVAAASHSPHNQATRASQA